MSIADRDLLAIQEDGLLIDVLAARGDISSFADDHIALLLDAYAGEIDADFDHRAKNPPIEEMLKTRPRVLARSGRWSGRSARVVIAASTAAVLIGTSGVAAAVTGDPFSPYKSVVRAVTGDSDVPVAGQGRKDKALPSPAATAAQVARSLKGIKQALAQGDLVRAQRLLDQARVDAAGDTLPPGLQNQLDQAQDTIDNGGTGKPGQPDTKPDKPGPPDTKPDKPGPPDTKPDKPGPPDTKPTKDPKPDTKPTQDPKPDTKPDPKPDTKPTQDPKPDTKPTQDPKPDTKPANDPNGSGGKDPADSGSAQPGKDPKPDKPKSTRGGKPTGTDG